MGFRNGAYATVWKVESVSPKMTKIRISITRKNEQGDYEQTFSGFPVVCGTAMAKKALSLKDKDRIVLGEVDVTTKYDKEKDIEYVNYLIYSYEMADNAGKSGGDNAGNKKASSKKAQVDDGEVEEEDDYPF